MIPKQINKIIFLKIIKMLKSNLFYYINIKSKKKS